MATPLIEGLFEPIGRIRRLAGMGMIGDMQLQPTWQFFDQEVLQQSASAVMFQGGLILDTVVIHGCRPAGRYHEITKVEGPVLLEIDGRPALDVIHEMIGVDSGMSPEDYAVFVIIGVNSGDPYGDFSEEDYANRICIGVDVERKALIMFDNDLQNGDKFQLMRRSLDFSYIRPRVESLFAKVEAAGRKPKFAFYIDCAGRAAQYCGLDSEEADELRNSIPAELPLLGLYSGVEIAPIRDVPRALDLTGVLCLLSL